MDPKLKRQTQLTDDLVKDSMVAQVTGESNHQQGAGRGEGNIRGLMKCARGSRSSARKQTRGEGQGVRQQAGWRHAVDAGAIHVGKGSMKYA